MPDNLIRNIYIARFKQLIALYNESEAITHSSTKGTMREEYLKDFLKQALPQFFWPVSGFIADRYGNSTPQLDMIFFSRAELPALTLIGDVSVVPAQIALATVEVKSIIDRETFAQLNRQKCSIEKLQHDYLSLSQHRPRERPLWLCKFLLAFESDLRDEELEDQMKDVGLEGICVVNKHSIIPHPMRFGEKLSVKISNDVPKHEPLLAFVAALYRSLHMAAVNNSGIASTEELDRQFQERTWWPWELYLSEAICEAAAQHMQANAL